MNYEKELLLLAPKQRKSLYQSYNWLVKVIDSCITPEHINYCDTLIEKFYRLHGSGDLANMLTEALLDKNDQIRKK